MKGTRIPDVKSVTVLSECALKTLEWRAQSSFNGTASRLISESLTSQSPRAGAFVRVPAVENQVGVVPGPVGGTYLQKAAQLGLQGVQHDAAGRVVAAESVDHVVGEEALHVVQHARGAQVELLHLLGWQEGGLAIGAGDRGQKAGERSARGGRWPLGRGAKPGRHERKKMERGAEGRREPSQRI